MNIKLLNEQNFEFLSLKEGYTGSSESIHVKMPHFRGSIVALAHADVPSGARCLMFCRGLLHSYFINARSEGSGDTTCMRRPV